MATTASYWLMSESQVLGRGNYQRAIVSDPPYGVVDGTQRRDVSEALDLLALADTPFINRVGWGPESGGMAIEWISEDLGPGYIHSSICESTALSFLLLSVEGIDASDAGLQLKQGSVLYTYDSGGADPHIFAIVTSAPAAGFGTGVSVTVSIIDGAHAN